MGEDAYEFKIRVTIAASGQGRFQEELDFATDCRHSGFRPFLLVFDPTPNPRLTELVKQFEDAGGKDCTGKDAWHHIVASAGSSMGVFIERHPQGEADVAPTIVDD